jgi:type VI protein secretion system component Hcp
MPSSDDITFIKNVNDSASVQLYKAGHDSEIISARIEWIGRDKGGEVKTYNSRDFRDGTVAGMSVISGIEKPYEQIVIIFTKRSS